VPIPRRDSALRALGAVIRPASPASPLSPTTLSAAAIAPHALGETPLTAVLLAPHPRNTLPLLTLCPDPPALNTSYMALDSVSSPITKQVYNMALDEFLAWFRQVLDGAS
jgi:hypothetical protein